MVKLQAASVSNQVVHRKRKRKDVEEIDNSAQVGSGATVEDGIDLTTTTTIPTKTSDGGSKARRTGKGGKATL